MLYSTPHLLRRRGTGQLVKYLEGVPTPTQLIDHVAGADLHASTQLPFFSTVPRYIDTQREQRLSRLFFHHVLYPAGGARLPYQAVVVRGGRAVQTSTPRPWPPAQKAVAAAPLSSSTSSPVRVQPTPLAVPALHAASPSRTALAEAVPSSSSWARVDPARRPFFSPHASPPHHKTNPYSNARTTARSVSPAGGREDTARWARVVEDEGLRPLRGVVEHYVNTSPHAAAVGDSVATRLQQLLVAPSAGLLWMAGSDDGRSSHAPAGEVTDGGEKKKEGGVDGGSEVSPQQAWARLLARLQPHQQQHLQPTRPGGAVDSPPHSRPSSRLTFAYVETQLPPAAAVLLPVDPPEGPRHTAATFLCRLAGGVEPAVPFAVGRPLTPPLPPSLSAAAGGTPGSPLEVFFPHLSCLTRVNVRVPTVQEASAATAAAPAPPRVPASGAAMPTRQRHSLQQPQQEQQRSAAAVVAEPWKLGGDGLDLMVPQHARTVAEHHPTRRSPRGDAGAPPAAAAAAEGRYVLGRQDAETYLIPQRELLLTLYVPTHTEGMCAAQNQERLRRQVRAGRASPAAVAWPTEHARLTAARRALGQYVNAESARQAGSVASGGEATAPAAPTGASGNTGAAVLHSRTSYEVRALPGDVVYVPRGWGYDVQRIVGTAIVHHSHSNAPALTHNVHAGATQPCRSYEFHESRQLSTRPCPPSRGHPSRQPSRSDAPCAADTLTGPQVASVEVDAFCLHYQPYPELSEAQADVYVAANYVHAGIEEFYEKGGNAVYRSYK